MSSASAPCASSLDEARTFPVRYAAPALNEMLSAASRSGEPSGVFRPVPHPAAKRVACEARAHQQTSDDIDRRLTIAILAARADRSLDMSTPQQKGAQLKKVTA